MASGDTAAIDSIDVESALSTKNSEYTTSSSNYNRDQIVEQDEYGKFIKDSSGKQILPDGMSAELGPRPHRPKSDKERKIGHRRVGEGGEITYKKIQTTQIMGSIQLGIQHTVGSLASKPRRDLLMMDFWELETISFPPEGSSMTPAHHFSEFKFKIYAPIAFRYFRDLFGIQPDDFMMSMCSAPLRELSNPGASGSIFYLTDDDEFIIKTVQHKEGEFLQKLLPGYYMNLNQNPRTLLPKFFGLYCYQCNSKNVRLVAMNNLLPSYVKMHLKYDLKGSTYKRKANKAERAKSSPTYKDLDFIEHHPNGIFLEADTCNALIKTIQRDCRVLESFKIMDYSLLVGIHNLDLALKEKQEAAAKAKSEGESDYEDAPEADQYMVQEREEQRTTALNRSRNTSYGRMLIRSINRQRLVAHSTAMESIQAESEPIDEEDDVPPGGIPARSEKGERLLLFIGIIDILQSYRLRKKLEHTFKSIIHDGDTVSVHRPSFYAQRFQDFMAKTVFKKIPSPLKHSPSKRKSLSKAAQRTRNDETDSQPVAGSSHQHHHHHHQHQQQQFHPTQTHFNQHTTGTSKPDVDDSSNVHTIGALTTTSSSSGGVNAAALAGPSAGTTGKGGKVTSGTGSAITPTMPPLKKKTSIVKASVPPPVPPRGSPKMSKAGMKGGAGSGSLPNQSSSHRGRSSAGKIDQRFKQRFTPLSPTTPELLDTVDNFVRSPNKVLSWLSHPEFQVVENGEQMEMGEESSQEVSTTGGGVRKLKQNFERSSPGMNDSMSSVKQMIHNFERYAPVRRPDTLRERTRRFSVRDEPAKVELSRRSSFVVPSVREHLTDDETNSNVESRKNFVPMAERIQEYEEERNDDLVLSKLTDVVRSRRVMFASPNSTLERPQPTKKQVGNGSVVKHVTIRLDNDLPRKTKNPDELRRRIEEIEREIRENEKRLKAIPDVINRRPLKSTRKVTKSDSLLCRLKPRSAVVEPPSTRKANIIRQLGLPLDENHNLESYLSQFSLEGEFV
ncbi:uncharacterized protein LOC129780063 isoform X3 [Toxorhynchites rutilus septentrionalis]|uniref:uncharacterized protein LOC129780063 isoform X3 n=1 Tax=Toxorhynchites rutilus septentrionalis TaxID=329112 RepID=UPI002479F862|nr:uncharacterized protein LOC129780063 isoform X3 [Toxorhynchites rutilus septentrionalis]